MYNLKNHEGQEKFEILTTETNPFTEAVNNYNDDLKLCTKNFLKCLNSCISKSFQKIRIIDKPRKDIDELFEKRKILKRVKGTFKRWKIN